MSRRERDHEREAAKPEPAPKAEPREPPACGNCPYFRPPIGQAAAAGWTGACLRYPSSVPKRPENLCGEHPRFHERERSHA